MRVRWGPRLVTEHVVKQRQTPPFWGYLNRKALALGLSSAQSPTPPPCTPTKALTPPQSMY